MAVEVGAAEILHAVEMAGFARHLHHAFHSAADHDHSRPAALAASATAFSRATLEAKVVTGDPAFGRHHQLGNGGGDLVSEVSAVPHRIGGIADMRQHAGIAKLAQTPFVGRQANNGSRIDLPVAGMQHGAD